MRDRTLVPLAAWPGDRRRGVHLLSREGGPKIAETDPAGPLLADGGPRTVTLPGPGAQRQAPPISGGIPLRGNGSEPVPSSDPRAAEDARLVIASRTDPEAFGVLYDHYVDRVHRFVYARLRDHTNAEDVTAEIFFKALRGLSGFRPETGTFSAWLFRIARNAVIDHERARRPTVGIGEALETHDRAPLVEDQVVTRADVAHVLRLIDTLPPAQRAAVLLRLERDLPIADIAVRMERSEGAVRVLLHRAMTTLRARLASPEARRH